MGDGFATRPPSLTDLFSRGLVFAPLEKMLRTYGVAADG